MRHKYVNWKWSNLKGCWYPNQMTKLIIHLLFIVPWWVLVNVGRLLESGTEILIDYQPGIMTNLVCWTWFSKSTISQRTGQRTVPSLASSFMKTAGSLRFFKGPDPLPHSKFSSKESEPAVLRFLIFFKGPEPTVLWFWNCWKNQNRWFFDPGILKEWELKVIWKVKEPSNTRSLSSCLPPWGDGSHFEREREKREIGEFFVGPDQNCKRMWVWGLREREGWVFASTLGSRKAKWP